MNLSELLSLSTDYLRRRDNLKKTDILTLREVVREHNRLYYQSESPIISDTEYDELFHALARAEVDHDMFDSWSPTARLAILASEQFQKVAHIYPMISLDNTYSVEEVRDFEKRMRNVLKEQSPQEFPYYVQPKYDGLGLAVIYRYGKLEQAVTRGSGVEWEDVTLGAYEIVGIPKDIGALRDTERMEIRGEVMMSRTTFDRVNRERLVTWDKLFANPRNCASGSLRQLDPLVTRSRDLQFFAYAIPQIEQAPSSVMSSGAIAEPRHPAQENIEQDFSTTKITDTDFLRSKWQISSYHDMMDILSSWWFEREDFEFRSITGIDALCERIQTETENRREYFDFDIDGIVLKLDDMMLWDDLGRTEHHPRYAIAYKFPAKQVRTRVISIEHSVGRTGTVTPVANLEAVDVSGVIVRRATLHNYDELQKKWVREGDYVFIMRAGEVIPEIVSVITEVRTGGEKVVQVPIICPVCSTPVEQDDGKVAIYCPNVHCPAKIQGQLEMFAGKQGMNIDGLWVKQIELFLSQGWITDFASVFQLATHADEMLILEGYKQKSVANLIESLEKARHTTLDRVLTAIGIPNVGKKTAKTIAKHVLEKIHLVSVMSSEAIAESRYLALENTEQDFSASPAQRDSIEMTEQQRYLLDSLFSTTPEELLEIKDIWPETALSFVEYMRDNRELVEGLFAELDIASPPAPLLKERGAISEKSFCVTGSFDGISRDEIHELIEANWGEVRSAVSGKLDYLVVGTDAGSKKSKAEDLGVKCIDLLELRELVSSR